MTEPEPSSATRPMSRAARRGWGCLAALVGLLALSALVTVAALWRRSGDPVRFDIQLDGAPLPASAEVDAVYRPEARIPLLTHEPVFGNVYTVDVAASAAVRDGWLSFELDDGWRSIRDEWLDEVEVELGGGAIAFRAVREPPPFGPPVVRADEHVNPLAWAARDGDVGTLRAHAMLLPSTIRYDAQVHRVRVIIDVHPISIARLASAVVDARPGVPSEVFVGVRRTGSGWPDACHSETGWGAGRVQAVIVREEDLVTALGWRAGLEPVAVGPDDWATLAAHHDARFALAIDQAATGATLRFTAPAEVETDATWHVLAVAFAPGDHLAAAAEAYLELGSDERASDELTAEALERLQLEREALQDERLEEAE